MDPLGKPRTSGNDVQTIFAGAAAHNPKRKPVQEGKVGSGSVYREFEQPAFPRDLHCVYQPRSLLYLPKDIFSETP